MTTVTLHLELLSATTFGQGGGVAGLVDSEVEHTHHGFPFLRGRTLKGLLREAAEEVVFALEKQNSHNWGEVLEKLFGNAGSGLETHGIMRVGDAHLPLNLRRLLQAEMSEDNGLKPDDVLDALTGIRRQTAVSEYGAPRHGSLRSMRVVLRGVQLEAELTFEKKPEPPDWALLVAASLNLRAAGTGRNRGRGKLRATLETDDFMREHIAQLTEA